MKLFIWTNHIFGHVAPLEHFPPPFPYYSTLSAEPHVCCPFQYITGGTSTQQTGWFIKHRMLGQLAPLEHLFIPPQHCPQPHICCPFLHTIGWTSGQQISCSTLHWMSGHFSPVLQALFALQHCPQRHYVLSLDTINFWCIRSDDDHEYNNNYNTEYFHVFLETHN